MPKHMPEASSVRMSTLWKRAKRGWREMLRMAMEPMRMGTKMAESRGVRVGMWGLCQGGELLSRRFSPGLQ